MKHRERGITLLETMVTVSIVVTLIMIGVPGMIELIRDTNQSAYVMDIVSHLNHARSEAIMRGYMVTVCPSNDGATCLGTAQWQSGWITFADANGNGAVDIEENILKIHGKLKEGSTLMGSRNRITYRSNGYNPGNNDTLKLCDARGTSKARSVVISMQGRVRVAAGATSCP